MSLLINGVDMPDSCLRCRFLKSGWSVDWVCCISNKPIPLDNEKPNDCPLIEVNSEGRQLNV